MHVGKAEFYPLNAAVLRALATSSWVYLELDISNPVIVQNMARAAKYPDGDRLDEKLPPTLMNKVEIALGRFGVSKEQINNNNRRPLAVAAELKARRAVELGYSPEFATDIYVAAAARILNKRIFGLESVEEQAQAFSGVSEQEQQAYLEYVLSRIDTGGAAMALESLVRAWASGDRSSLEAAFQRAEADDDEPLAVRKVMRRMLDDRNENMAERIDVIFRTGMPTFVAVGAAHLVGPNSVVELLRKRGFTVREL